MNPVKGSRRRRPSKSLAGDRREMAKRSDPRDAELGAASAAPGENRDLQSIADTVLGTTALTTAFDEITRRANGRSKQIAKFAIEIDLIAVAGAIEIDTSAVPTALGTAVPITPANEDEYWELL